jgi:hypothetical protein
MARPTREARLQAIHAEAMAEFDAIQSAVRDIRLECLQDRRFYSIAGAQWEGALGEQFENRLKFEFNKVHQAVNRIISEYRNNRITVDYVSKEGEEYDELAEVCDDLYRADEQDSGAEEAYDNAFEEGVAGGFGAFRLRNAYEDDEDEENDKQRIRIEPIFDADSSVFFDLNAKRQDKADAKRCFVLSSMTKEAYEAEYGECPTSIEKTVSLSEFDWFGPDVAFIAEYYRVEEKSETIRIFESITGEEERYSETDFANDENLESVLLATGWTETGSRKVKRKKVRKYLISGSHVLEDCGYIAGNCIPIVPFYGKRWFVDNIERCMGHVRLAKDAQRLKNMQLSKLGEIAAVSPTSKPIFTPEQMAGVSQMWADDPVQNYPYLMANPVRNIDGSIVQTGPTAYTKAPEIPPAVAALIQMTDQDMQDILGNQQQADKVVSNISGDAVEMIQQRLDMQSFIYMSNFAKSIRRAGEIWLSMARDVYVEKNRKLKGVKADGSLGKIELMTPYMEDGEMEYKNDLSEAKFDVAVDVGPTSDSKRQATVRSIIGMMQVTQDPETLQVLSATALMNMKGEGVSDLRDFFRQKLVRLGAVKPTDEEAAAMQQEAAQRGPDAQAQYLQAASQEAEAKAAKARADTVLTVAQAEKTRAQTAETLAGIDRDDREELMKVADALRQPSEQNPAPAQPV